MNRPRADLRSYKKLSLAQLNAECANLPIRPPIWKRLSKHQRVGLLLIAKYGRVALFYDTGCVAGETLIETERGPVRIDELEKQNKPIRLWANTVNGLRLTQVPAPFKKGIAPIYEVGFKSGRSIHVTKDHRFLTERGWTFCGALQTGECLPLFGANRQQSTSGLSPLEYLRDAPHSTGTQINYQDHCYQYYHPHDEQSQLVINSVSTSFPSPNDFLTSTHLFSHGGGLGIEQSSTHLDHVDAALRYHLSKNHYENQGFPDSNYMESSPSLSSAKYYLDSFCNARTIHANAIPSELVPVIPEAVDEVFPLNSPFDTVTSVRLLREDVYYDLHVPIYHNYIAHGLCHHNTGKTLITIASCRYLRKAKLMQQALVLVPNRPNVPEWVREVKKHSPHTSIRTLTGSTKYKWETLEGGKSLLTVTTFMGLVRMVCVKKIVYNKKTKKKRPRLVPDMAKVRQLCKHFDGLFLDESIKIGNRAKLPFRICRQVAKRCKIVVPMCGTPFDRDPTPVWAQMFLVDRGEGLGENLGLFRGALFNEKENYWSGFPEYKFDKTKKALLTRFLAHRSLRVKVDEADLPRVNHIRKYVRLPEDTKTYYLKAKANLKTAVTKEERENMFLRMRQISSGFLGYKDEDGKKAKSVFAYNPKLDMLESLVESIRGEYKSIIFHDFIPSGEIVCNMLKELKIGHVWVRGKVKNAGELLEKFDHDPKTEIMVLNTAGAFGLNLQKAKYGFFYESPVSGIMRKQMERRFIRQHSEHDKVFLYDLLVKGTVDEQIRVFHRQGRDLLKAIIDGSTEAEHP